MTDYRIYFILHLLGLIMTINIGIGCWCSLTLESYQTSDQRSPLARLLVEGTLLVFKLCIKITQYREPTQLHTTLHPTQQ